jgi:hypothetical protein
VACEGLPFQAIDHSPVDTQHIGSRQFNTCSPPDHRIALQIQSSSHVFINIFFPRALDSRRVGLPRVDIMVVAGGIYLHV